MAEVHRYLNSLMGAAQGNSNVGSGNNATANVGNSVSFRNTNNLRVNTKVLISASSAHNSRSSSAANSPHNLSPRPPPPTSGPGSGKGIDFHPFSRGSVIEVLYVKRKKIHSEDVRKSLDGMDDEEDGMQNGGHVNWDDDESTSDWFNSDSEDSDEKSKNDDKQINEKDLSKNKSSSNSDNVYLADIIDRTPLHPNLENTHPSQRFKYYIHYRTFNRRMDEWITMERIVSPPSVGNARVRAIKRKEDRMKREEEERKERERILNEVSGGVLGCVGRRDVGRNRLLAEDVGLSSMDGSVAAASAGSALAGAGVGVGVARKRLRRTASTGVDSSDFGDVNIAAVADGSIPSSSSMDGTDEPGRLTRRQRGVGAVGVGGTGGTSTASASTATAGTPGALAPNIAGGEEQQTAVIDEVTTIAAQVLDEHEGMDAAALKEHEEVTKVKNVATLELGKYQMDTWYFSPLPKELMKDVPGGMIEVLYVDEFSLNFFVRKEELLRYQRKTLRLEEEGGNSIKGRRHPPGNEIYRCGNLSSEYFSTYVCESYIFHCITFGFCRSVCEEKSDTHVYVLAHAFSSSQCLKLMVLKNGCTVRIYATLPNCSWIIKLFTLMWIHFCFMSFVRWMNGVRICFLS